MPDQYNNPDIKICQGIATWVPSIKPNMGGPNPLVGFRSLIINRGAFRNYNVRPGEAKDAHAPTVTTTSNFNPNIDGDLYNPIINSTRPLAINGRVELPNNENAVLRASGGADLITFDFNSTDAQKPLSCIRFSYDLSFFYLDDAFNEENFQLTPNQLNALNSIKGGNISASVISTFINGLTPPVLSIYGEDSSGTETEIASVPITRARLTETESNLAYASNGNNTTFNFQDIQIKTSNDLLNRSSYPKFNKIIFKLRAPFVNSSLVFILKKISFYTADRVNFSFTEGEKQLPCTAIGYSMFLDGKFYPAVGYAAILVSGGAGLSGSGSNQYASYFYWPQDGRPNSCTVHVKLFNPDYTTGSPGFAHSLNIRLIVLSFPMFGPLADFLLPGSIAPHFGVIIGPRPFNHQMVFYGNASVNLLNLAVMNSSGFKQSSGIIRLVNDSGNVTGIQKRVYTFKDFSEIFEDNQLYYEVVDQGPTFQNQFQDQFGLQTLSGKYTGSYVRGSVALQAKEVASGLSGNAYTERKISYNTLIFRERPSLYELFTNSLPCLIFKCTTANEVATNTFLQPGFIGASIPCFVSDLAKVFNTQLVYRIYVVKKDDKNIDPNSTFSKRRTFKIENSGTADSTISVTEFNSEWDFSNVLVTGNIGDVLTNVAVEQMISDEQNTFNIYEESFDVYCAIYAMSYFTDTALELYETSNLTSLDFPLITFSIKNNFILTLPVFYRKSYTSGGFLQAQRDFGAKGEYTSDGSTYSVSNLTASGQEYNPDTIYTGRLSQTGGFDSLLQMQKNTDGAAFTLEVEKEVVKQVDFVVNFDSISYSKIDNKDSSGESEGVWELLMSVDAKINLRYEIDLIDPLFYNLVLKLVSSDFQVVDPNEEDSGEQKVKVTISVPFFVPSQESKVVLKLFFTGDQSSVVKITKMQLSKNTLKTFRFIDQPRGAPVGFYEDLPIQPTTFIAGCGNFNMYLDLPSAGFVVYDASTGLDIKGAIYSPTWVVNLPENMELDYRGIVNASLFPTRATGVQPYRIFFRTGASGVLNVDTKRHKSTGFIVTAFNKETNISENAVKQVTTESALRFSSYSDNIRTPNENKTLQELNLKSPVMAKTEQLMLSGQVDLENNIQTALLDIANPGAWVAQPSVEGSYYPITSNAQLKEKMAECFYTAFDYKDFKTFTVGVTVDGTLLYAEDQFDTTAKSAPFMIIEGDRVKVATEEIPNTRGNLTYLKGPVVLGFPAVMCTTTDNLVFYVYGSTSDNSGYKSQTAIYCRYITGAVVSEPVLLFDFEAYCASAGSMTDFPTIANITVAKHDIYTYGDNFYLAFECAKKAFILKVSYTQHNFFVTDLAIVYGSLSPGSGSNSNPEFTTILNTMINQSLIYRFRFTDTTGSSQIYDKDLESSQKLGFVDYDGIFLGVQFVESGVIKEAVFDKSYSIPGEIRVVTTI